MPRRSVLAVALCGCALAFLAACSRGKSDAQTAAQLTPIATSAAPPPETPPAPTPAPAGQTPTPAPTPVPAPFGPPTPAPTAAPRTVNGLLIQDEVFVGVVREAGGLRIRSAPRIEPGNVVGSVAKDTPVNVEGRVLNGQEAEPGKGTIWLIVGPSQYIYAAPGYVERIR